MQKKGGHFILKIFDIFSKLTVDLLYLLSSIYAEVYITKPYTSRLANSEKYIVCKNFLLDSSVKLSDAFVEEFPKLNDAKTVASILNIEHDYYFLNKIEEINVVLGQRQLENIITTLNIITNRNSYDKVDSMKKLHIQKSISWCEKHDISSVKLYSSSNIFLSNIYEDGTPISILKHNNNAFLKNKSSNFTNNVYVGAGAGGAYNKNKLNPSNELENCTNGVNGVNGVNAVNAVNEIISSELVMIDTPDTSDTHVMLDSIETNKSSNQ